MILQPNRNPLLIRRDATRATIAKFENLSFEWYVADCARLASHQLLQLGHKPVFSRFGKYSTDQGALKQLKRQGFNDTLDWMNSIKSIVQIPPAYALEGDIIGMPGLEGNMTALGVYLTGRLMFGYHPEEEDKKAAVIDINPDFWPRAMVWKADPCRS